MCWPSKRIRTSRLRRSSGGPTWERAERRPAERCPWAMGLVRRDRYAPSSWSGRGGEPGLLPEERGLVDDLHAGRHREDERIGGQVDIGVHRREAHPPHEPALLDGLEPSDQRVGPAEPQWGARER